MPIIFPPHEYADRNGLLALGGDLKTETILSAYTQGIFPWPIENHLAWFSPPKRAILFFDQLKISRSIYRTFKNSNFEYRINNAFKEVISNCANSKNREGTWITVELAAAYTKLFDLGICHSFECYQDNRLVGGGYGLSIGTMFAAESMFYLESGASKLSLLAMIAYLSELGFTWIDCQQQSPHLAKFGAEVISRKEFLKILKLAIKKESKIRAIDSQSLKTLLSRLLESKK